MYERGFKIKIDTNGTNPDVLKQLLPYLSVVAMDIKEDFDSFIKYNRICRNLTEKEFKNVSESIKLLSDWYKDNSGNNILIFRTTLFDNLIDTEIIERRLSECNYSYQDYIIQSELTKTKR